MAHMTRMLNPVLKVCNLEQSGTHWISTVSLLLPVLNYLVSLLSVNGVSTSECLLGKKHYLCTCCNAQKNLGTDTVLVVNSFLHQ